MDATTRLHWVCAEKMAADCFTKAMRAGALDVVMEGLDGSRMISLQKSIAGMKLEAVMCLSIHPSIRSFIRWPTQHFPPNVVAQADIHVAAQKQDLHACGCFILVANFILAADL